MNPLRIVPVLILLIFSGKNAHSQALVPDHSRQIIEARVQYILALNDSITGIDRQLVNGEIYSPDMQAAANHPFFMEESWVRGTVVIDESTYADRLLRYDLSLDRLIYLHISDDAKMLVLNREFVSAFMLGTFYFEFRKPTNPELKKSFDEGYYQVVYNGAFELLAKWAKQRIKNNGPGKDEFRQNVKLLLGNEKGYMQVKNDRQLHSALEADPKELRKYMKQNNIHVRTSSPEMLARVVQYSENVNRENQ